MENILIQFVEPFLTDQSIKNLCLALSHYKIDSFLIFHRRNKQLVYRFIEKYCLVQVVEKYEKIINFEDIHIFKHVCKHTPNKYIEKYKNSRYNYFNEIARNGHNDTLILLKEKFPEIKGTNLAFGWAAENGQFFE